MREELERIRSSTPQPMASKVNFAEAATTENGVKKPRRRRRVVSVRRFKVNSDGTKQLISVTTGPTTYIRSRNFASSSQANSTSDAAFNAMFGKDAKNYWDAKITQADKTRNNERRGAVLT